MLNPTYKMTLPALKKEESIAAIGQALRTGTLTSAELVTVLLDRIAQINPILNSFITVLPDAAIHQAKQLDLELKAQIDRGKLHGIPIAIKDNIDTAGILTTIGSGHFRDRVPTVTAPILQSLTTAGAILLGKTNLTEFAADISGRNPLYGNMLNPSNLEHTAGGSSGGMASAIAANLCAGGIGTDTGGSIRVPASWTGIVGLRPTHGLIDTFGVFPRAPSFDTVGVMARSVADVKVLWAEISIDNRENDRRIQISADLQGFRLGIINNYTFRDVDRAVAEAIHLALNHFRRAGAEIVTVESPFLTQDFDPRLYSTIGLYEFHQILGATYEAAPEHFGDKVRQDLKLGSQIAIEGYTHAQIIRHQQIDRFRELFHSIDLLITPTNPGVAPLITANVTQRDRRFAMPFSWLGLPAISIPCGQSGDLPIGLQLIGDRFSETQLLQVAAYFDALPTP
jgi:aspartyl-tRNA(Asn)/glutamyl-tRNA(Gln) amidotransferase subunit A